MTTNQKNKNETQYVLGLLEAARYTLLAASRTSTMSGDTVKKTHEMCVQIVQLIETLEAEVSQ